MSRERIKELREQRSKLIADSRKLIDGAEKENRGLRQDEKDIWKRMNDDVDSLKERIDTLESQMKNEDEDDEEDERADDADGGEKPDKEDGAEEDEEESGGERDHIVLPDGRIARVLKTGKPTRKLHSAKPLLGESRAEFATRQRRNSPRYRAAYCDYLIHGDSALQRAFARRDISADNDIVGGYLVAPQEFVADLIKFVDNVLWLRPLATKYTVSAAQSLGAPSLDVDPNDADWTSELAVGNIDTAMAFGKRELTPRPLAKRLKVSQKLLRLAQIAKTVQAYGATSAGGVEGLVRTRLGYKFAVAEEKAFQLGSGANQPLGLFTASNRGIPTTQDFLTGSSTSITADGLIAAKYSLKPQYWGRPSTKWLFSRLAVQYIRQLKTGEGQYIWKEGLGNDKGDQLLDIPLALSEYTPNTFATGQYVGMLGDFSFYWIADSEQLVIQRLVELYAEANQIGFIARRELDGMPVLAEAFVRLRCN